MYLFRIGIYFRLINIKLCCVEDVVDFVVYFVKMCVIEEVGVISIEFYNVIDVFGKVRFNYIFLFFFRFFWEFNCGLSWIKVNLF